jgi:hypothetical protein
LTFTVLTSSLNAIKKAAGWCATVACSALALGSLSVAAGAQTEITLKNSFIEKYKHRATIDTTFTVDAALRQVHPAKSDGDLHIAGRAPEIGLATVAEIMNAATEPDAVKRIHQVQGTFAPIKLSGAWRIWCEHGGQTEHIQDATLLPAADSNPDHVFEVHPVTRLGETSLLGDLKPIEGYTPKSADQAFPFYEHVRCRLLIHDDTTTIDTEMAGFNYVEFKMQMLTSELFPVEDGTMAFASVLDDDGEMLVRKRRMVFIKDSAPEQKLKTLKKGDIIHVLGVPRVSLALVSWRLANARTKPEILTWNLPYEIIVVGLYEDTNTSTRSASINYPARPHPGGTRTRAFRAAPIAYSPSDANANSNP